ncbi:ShlB/FhaC/HecB family hemolysin secretion/activation protein [Kovacikia minuta CCNUW1]|uniref:ShlB/FhaC/HecB family hemolysin secretion/activation protein n=1 Tax=Kovacikia minuta TaxID=2931930 RepID=UPI001CCD3E86|nr:ShlB/FhaC/HecB family hemolysin secretion/activation protein [Kovacikia minuta]UBF26129.1 ShlB/FhaC/HecB family hemolysin secretion/activation protein [Kovacikia minuta CCNUW1]
MSYRFWFSLVALPSMLLAQPLGAQEAAPIQPAGSIRSQQIDLQTPLQRDPQPPSTQPQPELEPPTPLPPPDQLLPLPATPPTGETTPDEIPETITVERFEVTGSTVFSPQDFAEVTKPFTGRPISIAELFQARSAVTQLYLDRGYITSGAYIPPQKLQGGVVEIRVVEGSLEDIKVTGLRRLNPNYVRSRLAIATSKPLNRNRLLEGLQLLQLNPLIESISAELSAGASPGESLLEVRVAEAKTFDVQILLDNGRSPSVGSFRRQLQLSEANLLGLGDRLVGAYSNTDGSNTWDFSYTLPINPRNGTISFNAGISNNDVIEEPFNILDIESESRYLELTLRQPLVQTPTHEVAVGITATQRQSKATLLDGEIPFPALGADDEGQTRLTALRFFQEATWRSNQEVFALRSQFSIGIDALNATINPEPPDSQFFVWRGQAQWVRLLAPETLLLLRADLQLADRTLLPFEQFALGGQDSVRGYRQDALLTDDGAFASAEVRIPILRLPQIEGLLQFVPFVDFGTGWNLSGRSDPDPQTLVSVGMGLRFQISDRLTVRLDWGIPLISFPGEKKTWQENGLYFSIIANPF